MGWGSSVFPLLIITPSGGFTGLFLYSPAPGPGNLIGSWTAAAGTDPFGNSFPKGINVNSGTLSGVVINALTETLNPGPLLVYGNVSQTVVTLTGAGNWLAPAGVTSVQVRAIGGGSGRNVGFGGNGAEFAADTAVAVTPGNNYAYSVGAGGAAAGGSGGNTTFAGDVVTVTAHGATATAPGSGSTNAVHFSGGAGGTHSAGGGSTGGAGGGSPGGPFSAGNAGHTNSGATGGLGGAPASSDAFIAPGAGGNGGNSGANGNTPPGFGGGAGEPGTGGTAAPGAPGTLVLVYDTAGSVTLVEAIATSAGTDPVTGNTYSRGFFSANPTFGDTSALFGSNLTVAGAAHLSLNGASLDVSTAGQGLQVAEGGNAKQGTATLAGGTVVVANTSITANSRVLLTAQTTGAGPGALRVSARTPGTSFTITSSNPADTSLVAYEIFEPG